MTQKVKIKRDDTVVVLSGKDKGKRGKVLKVLPSENKLVVDGVNVVTKHKKPTQLDAGGIRRFEKAIDVSNVAILDPKLDVPTRVGYKVIDGKKVRYAKKSGEVIDG
jgi:large subunit ribosomal protein L24